MVMNKNMLTIKLYPFYYALTADLVFYIPIDTLFLTYVKNLSASEVTFTNMFGLLICIIFQRPVIKIAKKIGNKKSVILGIFLLLISTIMLTFSNSLIGLLIHRLVSEVSAMFSSMIRVMIQNNLRKMNLGNDFVKIINRGNVYYGIVTLITTLIGGYFYNINNYLPLYLSIGLFFLMFVVSFFFEDSEVDTITADVSDEKYTYPKHLIYILISSALFVSLYRIGQNNSKLYLQYELQELMSYEKVTIYLTYIIFVSRIARILGNVFFTRIFSRVNMKIGNIMAIAHFFSYFLQVLGHYISIFPIKIILLSIGYIIILIIRDPYQTYIDDTLLKNTPRQQHQKMIVKNEVYRKISQLIINISFTIILINSKLVVTQIILVILAFVELYFSFKMVKLVEEKNAN